MSVDAGVWFDICWEVVEYFCHTVSLPGVKADSVLWLNHFTQWRVLEETPKLQLRL